MRGRHPLRRLCGHEGSLRSAASADERGTTIIELIVSMLLLALLSGAIGALVTVASSGQTQSTERLSTATDAHQLQRWFGADAQSADPSVLLDPLGTDRVCDGTDAGDRLRVAWGDGVDRHVALYRVRSIDTGAELVRTECVAGTVHSQTVVVSDLAAADAVIVGEDPDHPGSLRLAVGVRGSTGSHTIVLSEVVPDLGGSAAATTTRPGSAAPDPCTVWTLTVGGVTMPGTVTAQLSGTLLRQSVPIELRTNGSCGTMALQVKSASAVVATVALAHESSTDPATYRDRYLADLPSGPWTAGTYTLQVTDTGAPLTGGTGTLVLRRPCWISRLSSSPTVSNTTGGSKRLLSKDVVIEATVDDSCPDLALTITPTPPTGVPSLVLAAGSTTRTARIAGGTGPWTAGTYTVTIGSVAGAPSTSFAVGTTPACQVTGLAVVPDSVTLRPGTAGTPRGLRQGISLSIGTLGSCGTVTASIAGTAVVPAPGPYVVGTTPIVVGADPQLLWWPGTYSVRLQSSTAVIVGASNASFDVLDGCSATLTTGWSSKDLTSSASRPLSFSVTTASACDALTGTVTPTPPSGGTVSLTPSATSGPTTVTGTIARSSGWPTGRYSLTVLSSGVAVASTTFDIA